MSNTLQVPNQIVETINPNRKSKASKNGYRRPPSDIRNRSNRRDSYYRGDVTESDREQSDVDSEVDEREPSGRRKIEDKNEADQRNGAPTSDNEDSRRAETIGIGVSRLKGANGVRLERLKSYKDATSEAEEEYQSDSRPKATRRIAPIFNGVVDPKKEKEEPKVAGDDDDIVPEKQKLVHTVINRVSLDIRTLLNY
jgi:hypothetical protein